MRNITLNNVASKESSVIAPRSFTRWNWQFCLIKLYSWKAELSTLITFWSDFPIKYKLSKEVIQLNATYICGGLNFFCLIMSKDLITFDKVFPCILCTVHVRDRVRVKCSFLILNQMYSSWPLVESYLLELSYIYVHKYWG